MPSCIHLLGWVGWFPCVRWSHSPEIGMWEIAPGKSPSIRQPHWHCNLDVKRPFRAVEELHQVVATRTEQRLSLTWIAGPSGVVGTNQAISPRPDFGLTSRLADRKEPMRWNVRAHHHGLDCRSSNQWNHTVV